MSERLGDLLRHTAERLPERPALRQGERTLPYAALAGEVQRAARALVAGGLPRGGRVAVYLPKQIEAVVALFAAATAGGAMVPINPALRAPQVAHILDDCAVDILVTSRARLRELGGEIARRASLRRVIVVGEDDVSVAALAEAHGGSGAVFWCAWETALATGDGELPLHRVIDQDIGAVLYTSGSTGRPKGVVLSHRNLVAGARSVASYLDNVPEDRLLAVLPLSFDYGFSQLTTAFATGAQAVLLDYLLPRDVPRAVERFAITGLAAVPPLWIQLARLEWPAGAVNSLRYLTNSGGAMPRATVTALRERLPRSRVYLMYGLTEAFRSTYLPPEELDRRPDSIGKAIPNAEVMVLRPDGTPCEADEPGELVHRGALVSLGYWNDPERTARRFRPLPASTGSPLAEIAVWSGDTVRADREGYLYFIGRDDEMIKTSGYRVSPTEIEEEAYASGAVTEAAALGVPHPELGAAIVLVCVRSTGTGEDEAAAEAALTAHLRGRLPNFMQPAAFEWREALPRGANGKLDRQALAADCRGLFTGEEPT